MIPYILSYSFLFFAMLAEKIKGIENKHKKIIMLLIVITLTLFRGLRWETGTDWEQFHDFFYGISLDGLFDPRHARTQSVIEPGYALLNLLFQNLTGSYTCLLLFYNAVILLIYYDCSWKYFPQSPINSFVCIIVFMFIFPLRQGFAVAIFLYGIRYILSKNMLKFGITIAIAASIHNTAILMFPCYFFLNKRISTKLVITLYLICLSLAESPLLSIIIEQAISIFAIIIGIDSTLIYKMYVYMNYNPDIETGLFITIFSFLRSIVFIFIFAMFRYKNKVSDNYNIFFNCFVLSLCIGILFKYQMEQIIRMQDYFISGMSLLLAYILGSLPKNKYIIFYTFIIFYGSYTLYKMLFSSRWHEYFIPYKSVFGS